MIFLFSAPAYAGDAPRERLWPDEATIAECAGWKPVSLRIACAMPTNLYDAHASLYSSFDDTYFKYDHAVYYFRLEAMLDTRDDVHKKIEIIRQLGLEDEVFEAMYLEALDWAEEERTKSAEAIYRLSQGARQDFGLPDDDLVKSFRSRYLLLAESKGHPKAIAELEAYRAQPIDPRLLERP